jgi:pyridoxal phosphate enzyme (YggS family)
LITPGQLASNLARTRDLVAAAARRAGRAPEEVTIVGVTKTFGVPTILSAVACGLTCLGENRPQEFRDKYAEVAAAAGSAAGRIRWHFIGHLQTNKVKYLIGKVDLIHSVDSLELLREISCRGQEREFPTRVLLQVDFTGQGRRSGLSEKELPGVLAGVKDLPGVRVEGLMTMAPEAEDPEVVRPIFARLASLARSVARDGWPGVSMRHVSMGMSGDFTVAVEEGATIVRVGTAIFGRRPLQG